MPNKVTHKVPQALFSIIRPVLNLALIIGTAIILSTCSFKPLSFKSIVPTQPKKFSELFTLEKGKYWNYRISKGSEQATITNKISDSRHIGGIEWFLMVEYGERFWVRNSSQGQMEAVNLYSKKIDDPIFDRLEAKAVREELIFKFPARPGDHWITLENTIRYEGVYSKTVPAGIYRCHLYSISRYNETYSHSCIAKDIGVVYSDNLLEDGQWEISELADWGTEK